MDENFDKNFASPRGTPSRKDERDHGRKRISGRWAKLREAIRHFPGPMVSEVGMGGGVYFSTATTAHEIGNESGRT